MHHDGVDCIIFYRQGCIITKKDKTAKLFTHFAGVLREDNER